MGRIDDIFAALQADNRKALMPFVCAGHPSLDATPKVLHAMQEAGASIAEIGIPFSDPIADGPVIASAMHRTLESGVTVEQIFEQIQQTREQLSMGLIAMVSVSIVQRWGGPAEFVSRAKAAGFDGLIIPDLPLEEAADVQSAASEHDLSLSFLVSPTTPSERAARLAKASTGFVYLMARVGITGERRDIPDIQPMVEVIRKATSLPIACGFGISTAEQVAGVVQSADAAIVGSALVRRLDQASDHSEEARSFVSELCNGLRTSESQTTTDQSAPLG